MKMWHEVILPVISCLLFKSFPSCQDHSSFNNCYLAKWLCMLAFPKHLNWGSWPKILRVDTFYKWKLFWDTLYRMSQNIVPNFEALFWSSALLSDKNVGSSWFLRHVETIWYPEYLLLCLNKLIYNFMVWNPVRFFNEPTKRCTTYNTMYFCE